MRPESNFLLCMAVAAFLAAGASPANAACTVPNILSNGQTADAIQLMQDFSAVAGCVDAISPTGTPNSLQFKTNTGSLAGLPLAAGQLPVGTGGAAPQGKALTAGPGIAITTAPGNITIAATSSGSANGVDWLNEAAVVRPSVAAFSLLTSTNAPAGAALVSTSRGMALTTSANANATSLMGETPTPSGRWQATMTGKIKVATFDLSADFLKAVAAGDAAFAIDQQQFLQGYLPVVFLANYAKYGLIPGGNVPSGPNLITKEKAAQVVELSAKGIR